MTFTSLASSSLGNAYVVSDGQTVLLLECGLPVRELQKRMGFQLSGITACLVSHEHGDHAKAAAQLLKRGIPVYMSEGTARAHKSPMDEAALLRAGEAVWFGALRVLPFRTFHNTDEPLGFLIHDTRTEERLLFAVDTMNLNVLADGLTHICIECNFQDALLARCALPSWLTERIRKSHFDLELLVKYLHKLDLTRVQKIWLLHLSRAHASEGAILERFAAEFPGIPVQICPE